MWSYFVSTFSASDESCSNEMVLVYNKVISPLCKCLVKAVSQLKGSRKDVELKQSSKHHPIVRFCRSRQLKLFFLVVAIFVCWRLLIHKEKKKMSKEDLTTYFSRNLLVEYKVLNNTVPEGFAAQITLKNAGSDTVNRLDWKLYFHHFRFIENTKNDRQAVFIDPGVSIIHINGPLFCLEPTPNFLPFEKGASRVVKFTAEWAAIARTDFMPNWYITVGDGSPSIIKCTESEGLHYVAPFLAPEQWMLSKDDLHHPFSPRERYDRNVVVDAGTSTKQVLPTPLEFIPGEGSITLDVSDWVIVAPPSLQNEADIFSNKTGLKVVAEKPAKKFIYLGVRQLTLKDVQVTEETYVLEVRGLEQNVIIMGHGKAGVFYGIQTFLNMLHENRINSCIVYDSPRFPYRGFMLDVSRNFFAKNEVMKIIDFMATYKLNQLHLHLADDEGWRIEIPDLPELTEFGARRGHDLSERMYLLPTLGSGPHPTGLGCGYYTQNDYKEILRYAADRHVTVIPEIDMPGHSNAAIKSMRARYHKYRLFDEEKAMQYLLHDLKDESQYHSVQLFKQNVINPCIESSYTFVTKVLDTLKQYHADIQPLKTFHLGGDEVPSEALNSSPACQEFFKKEGQKTMHQLKEHFVKRVIQISASKGLRVQAWEDGFYGEENVLFDRTTLGGLGNDGLTANAWISKWESKKADRAHEMANKGYKVVLTSATHLYFDHLQEPDPEERGLYWATRFIDLRKVFNFMPEDFWANMDEDKNGLRMDRDVVCKEGSDRTCTPLEKPKNIIGMEGALWGETVRTVDQLHHMIILRLLAFAERSWHRASWETMADREKREFQQKMDWTQFVNHLGYKVLPQLEHEGFAYYLPLPGAKDDHGRWKVNTGIPNHFVQYSTDGGITWQDAIKGIELSINGPFKLATRSFDGKRRSRPIDIPGVTKT